MTQQANELIWEFQGALLATIREYFAFEGMSLPQPIADAIFAVPRHEFVQRYRYWGGGDWFDVDANNLAVHLPALYRDDGLGLAGTDGDEQISTISRPSAVLGMLQMLDIRPGERIFELGTGSGWNAAVMGYLAGPSGHVKTAEIIPSLAARARAVMTRLGLKQVEVISGDAADAMTGGPFDGVIFTAGAYDIPESVFDAVRVGGRLLLVLKFAGGGDAVILFRRHADHFESLAAKAYEFVAMTGRNRRSELDPAPLEEFAPWQVLRNRPVSSRSYSHGGLGRATFAARTYALRTFLEITEPRMRWFAEPEGYPYYSFGLWDDPSCSLALAKDGALSGYGAEVAVRDLLAAQHRWVDLGLPSAVTLRARAYKPGQSPVISAGEALMKRPQTDFVWSLRETHGQRPSSAPFESLPTESHDTESLNTPERS